MDIGTGKGPTLSQLSTTALHSFVVDGVRCSSLESLIQALKVEKASLAASFCCDKPKSAKERAKKHFNWSAGGKVYWLGQAIDRSSAQHRALIERVIAEMARQCPAFRQALVDTGSTVLSSPGRSRESETPVTEDEYCSALASVRATLLGNSGLNLRAAA